MTEATDAVDPIIIVQAVSEVAVAAQRTRPIVAVNPLVVASRSAAPARSWQEDAVAIGAGNAIAVNAVKSGPSPSTVVI